MLIRDRACYCDTAVLTIERRMMIFRALVRVQKTPPKRYHHQLLPQQLRTVYIDNFYI